MVLPFDKVFLMGDPIDSVTDLEIIIGRNRLTLRRWWMEGKFPKPVKLNGNSLVWHSKTINDWIEKNIMSHDMD